MTQKFIIGIDLGGTNLKVALLDINYNIIDREVLSTRTFLEKEDLISGIVHAITRVIKYNNLSRVYIRSWIRPPRTSRCSCWHCPFLSKYTWLERSKAQGYIKRKIKPSSLY